MSNKRVFIIEDDDDIRDSLKDLLEAVGHSVETAENGKTGLESLKKMQVLPELIILDLAMPGMNGIQFMNQQAKDTRLAMIPVVTMTAGTESEMTLGEPAVSPRSRLKKPIDLDQILDAVDRYAL